MTAFKCKTCGKVSPEGGHLGKPKVGAFNYYCGDCGRGAVRAEELCEPQKLE